MRGFTHSGLLFTTLPLLLLLLLLLVLVLVLVLLLLLLLLVLVLVLLLLPAFEIDANAMLEGPFPLLPLLPDEAVFVADKARLMARFLAASALLSLVSRVDRSASFSFSTDSTAVCACFAAACAPSAASSASALAFFSSAISASLDCNCSRLLASSDMAVSFHTRKA